MKYFLHIIILFFAFTSMNAKPTSILFIGNSFTHMNGFSQMVASIATEMGDTILTDFSAYDSHTLEKHLSTVETIEKIKSYCWDYVVLQEQSQRPVLDMESFNKKTLGSAEQLLKVIYDNYPYTKPLLFMTWGRQKGDKELCKKYDYACTYTGMQNMLIERYNLLGKLLNIPVVPCGLAWRYFSSDFNSAHYINLFYSDEKHPNAMGSFLNALIFYNFITRKSTVGCKYNPANLTKEELHAMQKIADKVVTQNYNLVNNKELNKAK